MDHPSTSNGSPKASRSWLEEDNPFIAFRRYADEQISTILRSVLGLPSMVSSFPGRWPNLADENYPELSRCKTNGKGDIDTQSDFGERKQAEQESHYGQATQSRWSDLDERDSWRLHSQLWQDRPFNVSGADAFFNDSWLDNNAQFPPGRFRPLSPVLSDAFREVESPAWPISYLLFSPYSPIYLEHSHLKRYNGRGTAYSVFSSHKPEPELDQRSPQWCHAFEDLLRLESGKPMLERNPNFDGKRETGEEWLQGLFQRGSLGENWKLVAGPNKHSPCHIVFENTGRHVNEAKCMTPHSPDESSRKGFEEIEPTTELDLYDQFLQDISNTHERHYSRVFSDSPLMRLLAEERRKHLDGLEKPRRDLDNSGYEQAVKSFCHETTKYENDKNMPFDRTKDPQAVPAGPSVISTITTKERITLPDGSIQTKTINMRRFSDGREETRESAKVANPPQCLEQPSDDREILNGSSDSKSGWFWKS